MSTRRASCSCGRLEITCAGEPVRISVCHCLACQQRTGSAFGVQARYPREQVTHGDGVAKAWTRHGDEGTAITFHFCRECGATLWYELAAFPGFVAIPVGAFADPSFPPPTVSVYDARRHAWLDFAPGLAIEHLD